MMEEMSGSGLFYQPFQEGMEPGSPGRAEETLIRQFWLLRDLTHAINVAVEEVTGMNPRYVPFVMRGGGFFLWTREQWPEGERKYPLSTLVRKFLIQEGWIGTLVAPSKTYLLAEEVPGVALSLERKSLNFSEERAVLLAAQHLMEHAPREIYSLVEWSEAVAYDPSSGSLSVSVSPISKKVEKESKRAVRAYLLKHMQNIGVKDVVL